MLFLIYSAGLRVREVVRFKIQDIDSRMLIHVVLRKGRKDRYTFPTHLLEGGTDLRFIQELLGHSSSKTTEIYTHVTQKNISNIQSPLDKLGSIKKLKL